MADYLKNVEIIEFVCPYRNEINLYVTNISKTISMEVVEVSALLLFQLYSRAFNMNIGRRKNSS